MLVRLSLIVFFLCFSGGSTQSYGDPCNQDGVPGKCLDLGSCPSVRADPSTRWKLKRCGFMRDVPIVCCLDPAVLDNRVATPSPSRSTTTYVPPLNDYVDSKNRNSGGCAPIPKTQTSEKTGRKAWDKCIEYQEQLVYPCVRGVDFLGKMSRANNCNHKADELILGGVDAKRNEFPHMALLGYGETADAAQYQCGGSIVSDKFILTAGHCTYSSKLGPVTFAKVGVLRRSEDVPESRIHRIKRIIKHPKYKPPSKYHDIALLETINQIKLDHTTIPACLHIGQGVDDSRASAAGWGQNASIGLTTEVLQKVTLTKFSTKDCARTYRPQRLIKHGFNEPTQVCYGDHTQKKDTCPGDSGGPLQVNNNRIHCMYTVVGVTSFGRDCGAINQPGMYIRVDSYAPWIESIVWA